jgi:hypothetical protein
VTRRSEWSSKWRDIVVLLVTVSAGLALARAHDLGEFLVRFGVLVGLLGLVVLFMIWETRPRHRAYEAYWRTVCHVLDEDHRHEGPVLEGRWKGRPFRAFATTYSLGQYGGTVMAYAVTMPADHGGPAWKARRADSDNASRGSHLWTVRSDVWSVEAQLLHAGLLEAIEDAERTAVHVRQGTRLVFGPRNTALAYQDGSGQPPCAADLVVHLDLVRRAVDVHAAAMASGVHVQGGDGPHLGMDDPPTWVAGLWLPAALVAVAAGPRWLPAFALLPLGLAAPFLWRVRIGRRPGAGDHPAR